MTDPVSHAKSYPFPAPAGPFLIRRGRVCPLPDNSFDRSDRYPVLAAGSNRSHEQLLRKYAEDSGESEIPVQVVSLFNYDSVYAAHFAGYGSIPATLIASPGTVLETSLLWLDPKQLARMHQTERNYRFLELIDVRVETRGTEELIDRIWIYSSLFGGLRINGEPVALAEMPVQERVLKAMSQTEVQAQIRDRLAPGTDLDKFILQNIENPELRRSRARALSEDALPCDKLFSEI